MKIIDKSAVLAIWWRSSQPSLRENFRVDARVKTSGEWRNREESLFHRYQLLDNSCYATFQLFPSWEGQGGGCGISGVFASATPPRPLPRGEFAVIESHLLRNVSG